MQTQSFGYDLDSHAWSQAKLPELDSPRTLVLAFGSPDILADADCFAQLSKAYGKSVVVGCSSAGEIHGTTVKDRSLSVTVTKFDKTDLALASLEVSGPKDSFATGQALAKKLAARPGLRSVLLLSEGLNVNGSELIRGVNSVLDESIVVTGGLSGDGYRFKETWVALGATVKSNQVAAVGFYGDYFQVGHGSKGGWDKFGPERLVTRSEGNVLYELDGKPALALYKEYLGEKAKDLPSSGLLFPLSLRSSNKDDKFLVRTLLAVDHEKNSMTFAGDIPNGGLVQLMRADFERLINGASLATGMAKENGLPVGKEALVLAISCVGRRLVLGERTEEEVEAVLESMPKEQRPTVTGFYSYGEISPYAAGQADLHNQTMTLTVMSESPTPLPRKAGAGAAAPANVRPAVPMAPKAPARPSAGAAASAASPLDEIDFDIVTSEAVQVAQAAASTAAAKGGKETGFKSTSFAYDLPGQHWSVSAFPDLDSPRTLVMAFGSPDMLGNADAFTQLTKVYGRSIVVGCSSAGEIHGTSVRDHSLSVTVTRFEKTDLQLASLDVAGPNDSFTTGQALAKKLANKPGLRGVIILSEGLNVNGSELIRGVNSILDENIVVSGGLSGDGYRFKQTWVAIGAKVKSNQVAAVGLYGDYVQIGHGSKGGWDKFGPERVVTKSENNVLYELDGKPALALYKEYLGDKAKDLPSSGLLFPLSLRSSSKDDKFLVRTLLAVDHEKNSLTFAGDIPNGHLAQLMRADFERLINGASQASTMATDANVPVGKEVLVLAVSCVGRRLVLGERIEEELEAVLDTLPKGQTPQLTGFYSYGEISPYAKGHADLHNQTMTLTVISESPVPIPRAAPLPLPRLSAPAPAIAPPQPRPRPGSGTYASNGTNAHAAAIAAAATPSSSTLQSSRPSTPLITGSMSAPSSNDLLDSSPAVPSLARRVGAGPVTRMPLQASAITGANVQKQQRGDVTLVSISGRLTEAFRGEALGKELSGVVAFDLGGVERITSFGVREWLAMLGATQNVRSLFFLRCSEAVVNQLGMIRKFVGTGQIVSFFAPYLCQACGETFERSFDCEKDGDSIRAGKASPCICPNCDGEGLFDDDASSYFAFAVPHLNAKVPESIRALQDELEAVAPVAMREAVDKTVEGNVTRVRVQTKLDGSIRWKRVLDGIEGALVFDLGGVTGIDAAGIANFSQAVRALGKEVTPVTIERAPVALVDSFGKSGSLPRVEVRSAVLDAFCAACAVARPALVSLDEHGDALRQNKPPVVHCKRCNGSLDLKNADAPLAFLRSQLANPGTANAPAPISAQPGSLAGMQTDAQASYEGRPSFIGSMPPPAKSANGHWTAIAGGAVALAVFVLAFVQYAHSNASTPTAATTATAAAPTTSAGGAATAAMPSAAAVTADVDLPPSWVERPYTVSGDDIFVVGKAPSSATAELATTAARNDAVLRIVKQLEQDLSGAPIHDFVAARVHGTDATANDAIAARFLKQFGATATPERTDAALHKHDSGIDGYVRYHLSKTTYDQVLAAYRDTANLQGATVGRFFPTLESAMHTSGDLVVLSTSKGRLADQVGIRPGDVVMSIGGRSVASVDALSKAISDEWASTPVHGSMTADVETAGATRSVRFYKAGPDGR